MEKFWDHKQLRLLLMADSDAVERFLEQFGPVIYTWSYYQVGADAQIALDLTSRTFAQAAKNLSEFNPTGETLFQWLKQQAIQSRDEGLEHWQMKPQRPWAWSQLPDEILCELSRFRSDSLNEKVLSNAFVHEIVQAALAELEMTDRELLIGRYCHLDTAEHLAEEMDCGVEDIQDKLYRSRHSFRRVFFQLIASVNLGFSESDATGEIEIQDTNLEKLLSTTTVYQGLDRIEIDAIRASLLQAVRETSLPKETSPSGRLTAGIVLAVIVTLLAGIYWAMRNSDTDTPIPVASETTAPRLLPEKEPPQPENRQPSQDDMDGEELKRVFALGRAGHVDALLEVLKSGQFISQAAAAHFLGKLADANAIDLLQQAKEHWYPGSPDDDPFADAIEQILIRFPDARPPIAVEESRPDKKKQPAAIIPTITGTVSNFSNEPVINATLELTENPLFSKTKTGQKIASAKTDPNGYYRFPNIAYNGCASLTCRPAPPNSHTHLITQSLWCGKDSICVINIGGRPALTGIVTINGRPLIDQTLFLSDVLDISIASFSEEVLTDSEGHFSFLGISPGVYAVMNRSFDNRLHRLATVEMPQRDMFNVNLDIETVTVWLNDSTGAKLSNVSKAVLVYALDMPDNLNQVRAIGTEADAMLFENVIPGAYVLRVQFDSGVWQQQTVEITGVPAEQMIRLDPIPEETTTLYGHFLSTAPIDLFLTTVNQKIHIDIAPNANGTYKLSAIPSDLYSLAGFVNGQLVEFMQIDLQNELEMAFDINPVEMILAFSPLTVVVTDALGVVLPDAQVWLTGIESADLITASSTGQGAFLAAPAGHYTLSVAHSDYSTESREITLKASSLLTEAEQKNTIWVQMPRKSH